MNVMPFRPKRKQALFWHRFKITTLWYDDVNFIANIAGLIPAVFGAV